MVAQNTSYDASAVIVINMNMHQRHSLKILKADRAAVALAFDHSLIHFRRDAISYLVLGFSVGKSDLIRVQLAPSAALFVCPFLIGPRPLSLSLRHLLPVISRIFAAPSPRAITAARSEAGFLAFVGCEMDSVGRLSIFALSTNLRRYAIVINDHVRHAPIVLNVVRLGAVLTHCFEPLLLYHVTQHIPTLLFIDTLIAALETGKAPAETLAEIAETLAKEGKRKRRRRVNKR
jgi:hypothetical protein